VAAVFEKARAATREAIDRQTMATSKVRIDR
jgi:hypothetical protein